MKHNLKITLVMMLMFLVTQIIGIYVVNHYSSVMIVDGAPMSVAAPSLPFGLGNPEVRSESDFLTKHLPTMMLAFAMAAVLLLLILKKKMDFVFRAWFFVVITLSLTVVALVFLPEFGGSLYVGLGIAALLALAKTFYRKPILHNLTELFIYPGVAVIFIPLLNVLSMLILLVAISLYDVWAVWHSGIMQKMAKYQINKIKVFPGFFLPHVDRETKEEIKRLKKSGSEEEKKKEFKFNVAILGGGDVIFPIIASGVALKAFGFTTIAGVKIPLASLLITLGAFSGLAYLLFSSKEKKFYPAMPFISIGILVGLILGYVFL